jgi:hypothetical protein
MNETHAELNATSNASKAVLRLNGFWQRAGGAKDVLPYSNRESLQVLRKPETWVFFFFAYSVLPFYQSNPSSERLFLFLMIYFALAWGVCFYAFVARRRTSLWMGIATALFTHFESHRNIWFLCLQRRVVESIASSAPRFSGEANQAANRRNCLRGNLGNKFCRLGGFHLPG